MNVTISNNFQNQFATLDIDVIKGVTGTYEAMEIVEMFKNFFFSKMILDVTALKNYNDLSSYETLVRGIDADKIILFLPDNSSLCTAGFLAKLINLGIYNFTTNIDGVRFLLKRSNTLKDVENIRNLGMKQQDSFSNNSSDVSTNDRNDENNNINFRNIINNNINNNTSTSTVNSSSISKQSTGAKTANFAANEKIANKSIVIGFRNVTDHAGATTFIYMLKKELDSALGSSKVLAMEVDKNDFLLFRDKNMLSVRRTDLMSSLYRKDVKVILLDLNGINGNNICNEIIYLIEPSIIKLSKLMRKNRSAFNELRGKKVILNKSMLSNRDVADFESETKIKVFYNMPPLDDRVRNDMMCDFLAKMGLFDSPDGGKLNAGKIFGLFRR